MRLFFSSFQATLLLWLAPLQPPSPRAPADWLLKAKYVLTMDESHRVIEQGAVAIRGSRILAVGPAAELERRFQAKQTLDKPDALLAPGMIDTHTHAPMSLLRGLAEDKRLDDWLTHYIFPAESKNVTADFVRAGTRLACVEMVLAGVTTYTDMYYFEESEAEAAKEVGLRGVLGQTIIGFPAPDYPNWQDALAKAEGYLQRYAKDEWITPALAPHAIYTTPDEALIAAHRLAVKYNAPLLIHVAEMRREFDDAVAKRHLTPVQLLDKLGVFDGRVVAAHSIYLDDNDIQILHRRGVGVAHCPSSNTKMAAGVARVAEMLAAGLIVGLGTDGFAGSNDTADLFREMDLASKLQKVTRMDPTVLPAEQVVAMATIGGARVLGLERQIGSLEEGKRADIITVTLKNPHSIPLAGDVYSQLVHASTSADVEDVFINGRPVVAGRKVVTVDVPEVYRQAREYRARIEASLKP